MKYYIAFDGGGSKIEGILFDENLKFINKVRTGSMNVSFSSKELLYKNANEAIDKLLEGTGITEIECVYGVFSWLMRDVMLEKENIKFNKLDDRGGEGLIGLLAAFASENSVISLSGTGSVIFYVDKDGNGYEAGGYGSVIHDEGSGYHMARMAVAEAVKYYECRGPHTLIVDEICEYLGADDMGSAIGKIYDFEGKSPTAALASCAPCVGRAARRGDEIAKELLRRSATVMAEQTLGLIHRRNVPMDVPIVLEGGHWKNDRLMVDTFIDLIHADQPQREVIIPYFEPVVGAVLAMPHFTGRKLTDEDIAFLKEEYKDFRYKINE